MSEFWYVLRCVSLVNVTSNGSSLINIIFRIFRTYDIAISKIYNKLEFDKTVSKYLQTQNGVLTFPYI